MKNLTLTFKETTIEFKQRSLITLSDNREKHIYDVYMNGEELEMYTLTTETNKVTEMAEYRLYSQLEDSDTQLVHSYYGEQNFPLQAMVNLYGSIQK
jgi:hypothetical protein